jgi:hypothetical protein
MNNNYLQSLLNKIKASRDNSGLGELQKEPKPGEISFEMYEYEELETGSFKNRTPSMDRRVKGPVILDSQSSGNAANMLKLTWNSEDKKPKFIVLNRLVIDESIVEFLRNETSLSALLLLICQTNTKCKLNLSKDSGLKELYISPNANFLVTIALPSQAKKFAMRLATWRWIRFTINLENFEVHEFS